MLQEIKAEVQSTIAPLIEGILSDAQNLVKQELALAKTEVRQEIAKAKSAAVSIGAGVGFAVIAAILFVLTLVHFLVWAFPRLELWQSYAIVTILAGLSAVSLVAIGRRKAQTVNPLPQETMDSIKENAQWLRQKI